MNWQSTSITSTTSKISCILSTKSIAILRLTQPALMSVLFVKSRTNLTGSASLITNMIRADVTMKRYTQGRTKAYIRPFS